MGHLEKGWLFARVDDPTMSTMMALPPSW